MKIGILNLFSDIQDKESIKKSLKPFIESIEKSLGEPFVDISLRDIKKEEIFPIIMVNSGGIEEKFKRIYQQLPSPYFLLAGCLHNSLSTALEIKEYLKRRGQKVEILHGSAKFIANRLKLLKQVAETKKACRRFRVGVLGKPSDWLIGSGADYNEIRKKLGIRIYDIPIEEMIRHIDRVKTEDISTDIEINSVGFIKEVVEQSLKIYQGLKNLTREYKFNAISIRCFDLLDFYNNTGCLALSLLNNEGIVSGCEGDVPSLVSMIITNQLTDQPVFFSNPACIDQIKNEIIFTNCTIPINMCDSYKLKTHFESGKGIAICGKVKKGPVTLFKLNGNVSDFFLAEGELVNNLELPTLCRSQLVINLKEPVSNFLEKSIANHHIICKGWHKRKFEEFFSNIL